MHVMDLCHSSCICLLPLTAMEKLNPTQQKHTFTKNERNVLQHKKINTKKLNPGLSRLLRHRPGNCEGLFWFWRFINLGHLLIYFDTYPLYLQLRDPHGAVCYQDYSESRAWNFEKFLEKVRLVTRSMQAISLFRRHVVLIISLIYTINTSYYYGRHFEKLKNRHIPATVNRSVVTPIDGFTRLVPCVHFPKNRSNNHV